MKRVCIALFSLLVGYVWGQNIVPNPSFEAMSSVPPAFGLIANAIPWYSANGSSDLFHTTSFGPAIPTNFFGTQTTHTGNAYAGIASANNNSYHEYLAVPLSSPLIVGQAYYCEAYVSPGEGGYRMAINNFGFKFTTGAIFGGAGNPPISATPEVNWTAVISDFNVWTQVSGTFTATAARTHLTLGDFFSTAATTWTIIASSGSIDSQYWFIDDVVVQPATVLVMPAHTFTAQAVSDKTVSLDWTFSDMTGIKEFVVRRSGDGGATWNEFTRIPASQNVKDYATNDQPNIYGSEILYVLRSISEDGSVSISETIRLTLDVPTLDVSLALSPNPLQLGDVVEVSLALEGEQTVRWSLFDLSGRLILAGDEEMKMGSDSFVLETAAFAPGTYVLKVSAGMQVATRKLVVM